MRGRGNILKRLLIHVCGFNLGLVMRTAFSVGKPRQLQDVLAAAALALVSVVLGALKSLRKLTVADPPSPDLAPAMAARPAGPRSTMVRH